MTSETIGCESNDFEVSRSNVCEQGNKSWCIVISSVLSSKEKIDKDLIHKNIKGCESLQCNSFKFITSKRKIMGLHSNVMQNREVRFERTISIDSMSKVEFGGITITVRDEMKKVVSNGARLFSWVDRGTGKHNTDVLLLVAPIKSREAKICLNEDYVKSFKTCGKIKYETSVSKMQKKLKDQNEKIEK